MWPDLLTPKLARSSRNGHSSQLPEAQPPAYWLLSLYSPGPNDSVDWAGGDYRVTTREGRIESAAARNARKKTVRMLAEGSVVAAGDEPVGAAVDVAPGGFAHPVYRSGFCVVLKLPSAIPSAAELAPVETPSDEDALEARPCSEESTEAPEIEAREVEPEEQAPVPVESPEPESTESPAAQNEESPDEL
jgi:hypothetical protein